MSSTRMPCRGRMAGAVMRDLSWGRILRLALRAAQDEGNPPSWLGPLDARHRREDAAGAPDDGGVDELGVELDRGGGRRLRGGGSGGDRARPRPRRDAPGGEPRGPRRPGG